MKTGIVIMTRKKLEEKIVQAETAALHAGIRCGRVLGEAEARGSGVIVAMPAEWRQRHGR